MQTPLNRRQFLRSTSSVIGASVLTSCTDRLPSQPLTATTSDPIKIAKSIVISGSKAELYPTSTTPGVDHDRLQNLIDTSPDVDTIVLKSTTVNGDPMPWIIGRLFDPSEARGVILADGQSVSFVEALRPIMGVQGLAPVGITGGSTTLFPQPLSSTYLPIFVERNLTLRGDDPATSGPTTIVTAPDLSRPSFILIHGGASVRLLDIDFMQMGGAVVVLGAPPELLRCHFTECVSGPVMYLDDRLTYPGFDGSDPAERFIEPMRAVLHHCKWIRPVRTLAGGKRSPYGLKVCGGSVDLFQCEFDNSGVSTDIVGQPSLIYLTSTTYYVGFAIINPPGVTPAPLPTPGDKMTALTTQYSTQGEIRSCSFDMGNNPVRAVHIQPIGRPTLARIPVSTDRWPEWTGVCAGHRLTGNRFRNQSQLGGSTVIMGIGVGETYGHRVIGNVFEDCQGANLFVSGQAPLTIRDIQIVGNRFTRVTAAGSPAIQFLSGPPSPLSTAPGPVIAYPRETNDNLLTGNDYNRMAVTTGTPIILFGGFGNGAPIHRRNRIYEDKFPGPSPKRARDILEWVEISTNPAFENETQFGRLSGEGPVRRDASVVVAAQDYES